MAHVITLHVIYSHPGINISSTNLFTETHNGTHLQFNQKSLNIIFLINPIPKYKLTILL